MILDLYKYLYNLYELIFLFEELLFDLNHFVLMIVQIRAKPSALPLPVLVQAG